MKTYELRVVDSKEFNRWQTSRHYLKRPIIRSKLLAHGVFVLGELVGGLLWCTPHFIKKKELFGFPNLLDKWEVLVLGRFYLEDGTGLIASEVLSGSIGKGGHRGSHKRGWRVQEDWCKLHPPKFPQSPFVPRLLLSWSDTLWGHEGTIYKASGWEFWDTTKSSGTRTGVQNAEGDKKCWIMKLGVNSRAERIGLEEHSKKNSNLILI